MHPLLKIKATLSLFILSLSALSSVSFADIDDLQAPPGFKKERASIAFKGTGTVKPWLKISDSRVALHLLDLKFIPDCNKRVGKKYERNLKKYGPRTAELSQTIQSFNDWLLAAKVDSLDHSLRQGPLNFVVDPMCDETVTNGRFDFHALEPQTPNWWVDFVMEPKKDLDFHYGHTPIVIHEIGHFLFHTSLSKALSPRKDQSYYAFLLGALDEAFGDFVSYAFTGDPVVGRRYEYDQRRMIEFRRALSTQPQERQRVRNGSAVYATRDGDAHTAGQPFRDVLIEISQDYGNQASFELMNAILVRLVNEHWVIFERTLDVAAVNEHLNAVISTEFSRYPKLSR